jgi:hypothetical protein
MTRRTLKWKTQRRSSWSMGKMAKFRRLRRTASTSLMAEDVVVDVVDVVANADVVIVDVSVDMLDILVANMDVVIVDVSVDVLALSRAVDQAPALVVETDLDLARAVVAEKAAAQALAHHQHHRPPSWWNSPSAHLRPLRNVLMEVAKWHTASALAHQPVPLDVQTSVAT